jgi:hypothetical protein
MPRTTKNVGGLVPGKAKEGKTMSSQCIRILRSTAAAGKHFEQGNVYEIGTDISMRDAVALISYGKAVYFEDGTIENRDPKVENRDPVKRGPVNPHGEQTPVKPEHIGGGYYLLADGAKVKGKKAAYAAAGFPLE